MHTKLDRAGVKTTVVNASDLKILRAAREMINHAKDNVPALNGVTANELTKVICFFDRSENKTPAEPAPAKA